MSIYWLAFLTGLTTGGISCFAVQGGLLTSVIAEDGVSKTDKFLRSKKIIAFLIAKLIAYTALGFALGFLGERLVLSPKTQGWFQILIGVYMLIVAANLANIHPFFKRFVITPPKFIFRILRNQTKIKSFFTPLFLGALTIFIPCGVTQAMILLAISSGNPVTSALILFFFVLGTTPVFFAIGALAGELFKKRTLAALAAIVVAILGLLSINSGQVLRGSVHTFQNYWKVMTGISEKGVIGNDVVIEVLSNGYKSNVNTLKVGVPVKLTLKTNGIRSCSRAFTIPDLGISKVLPETGTTVIEFTPTKTGTLVYTCSMGMYSGSFKVIE